MKKIGVNLNNNVVLNSLNEQYKKYSEMALYEREFLNNCLLLTKPQKVLEIGVSSGASSVLILNALKHNDNNASLYSVDILDHYWKEPEKKVGFVLDDYPELVENHKLYTGGLICDFIEEIGNDIDFCFIDTAHCNPGEILDFVMILPFLKKNCTVIFHDTILHRITTKRYEVTNNILMSSIYGEKILPENYKGFASNIGGVILDDRINEHYWEIFNVLGLPWEPGLFDIYKPNFEKLHEFISRYYSDEYVQMFDNVLASETRRIKKERQSLSCTNEQSSLDKNLKRKYEYKYRFYRLVSNITFGTTKKFAKQKKYKYKLLLKR